jgi:signal transduction histidine kinase/ActR/RegA family two-component response regulator
VTKPVLAALGTACLVALLLLVAAQWYRQHLWLVWSPWDLRLFYFIGLVVVAAPALVVGLLVDRWLRFRTALRQKTREIEVVYADLARTNRALRALSAINHELIRASDEASLLGRICQAMVEEAGYGVAWVAMVEPGPDKAVRVAARAGENSSFLDVLGVRYDDSPRGHGPTGMAIREGQVVVVPNSKIAEVYQRWPDKPAGMDWIASSVSLPLRVDERVVGALTMYEPSPREYGREEVALLSQMADDVSYGLRFLRVGKERERAGTLLRQALRVSSAMARAARELVAGDLDLAGMAALVLGQAIVLTGSAWGGVSVISKRTGRVNWLASADREGGLARNHSTIPDQYPDDAGLYHGPLAEVLNSGASLCRNEAISLEGACPRLGEGASVARFLAVPLRARDRAVSGLLLLADGKRPYADRDVRAVQRLAMLLDMGMSRRQAEEEAILARRRAEAASESKTQFLANISQELRTPINGILGMSQLAMLEGVDERDAEYWRTVRDSTDKLVEIVDNLLELANVETGSLSPMLREFSLYRIIESLRGAFSVRAGLAGLSLSMESDPGIPDKLLGDPFRLRQILSNLLDNAIRFTPTGSVSVRVGPYQASSNPTSQRRVFVAGDFQGISLLFTVTDTGIGILPNRQASIFESFTLGEDYLTKRFGGAGMGLTIAKRLAELLGGSIWVESRPGLGSTFFLTMPLWPVVREAEEHPEPFGPVTLPPLRFLVVEDEAVNRLALARGLRKLGHEVLEACNGEEALRQLALERVDVVVMDVQMPVMDGLTAVGHIRGGEVPGADRRLPVVALTAYALEGDRKRFLDAGMDEFVTKPCDMDHLLRAVAKVVGVKAMA